MNHDHLHRRFAAIGADLRIETFVVPRWSSSPGYELDVLENRRRGDRFLVRHDPDRLPELDLTVPAVDVRRRHLVLQARRRDGLDQFLCGHDERHWFIAGLPRHVTGVDDAFTALLPRGVDGARYRAALRARDRDRRRNRLWKRQGEWFFLPAPWLDGRTDLVYHRDEPLRRGGGKPHVAEKLYRTGGQDVYADRSGTEVYTPAEFAQLRHRHWQEAQAATSREERLRLIRQFSHLTLQRRKPEVYVCGRITHPDHATLVLEGWHRVRPNREPGHAGLRSGNPLVFLD